MQRLRCTGIFAQESMPRKVCTMLVGKSYILVLLRLYEQSVSKRLHLRTNTEMSTMMQVYTMSQ